MMPITGAVINDTYTSTTEGKSFAVGSRFTDRDGKVYVHVRASAAIAQFDVVTFDETFNTTVAPVSTSNDARGDLVGVAPVAIASGAFGWLQIYGPCTMNVLASCAANVRLNTTATGGSLDDDGTAGALEVQGIFLTTARAASPGSAPGILNFPVQGVTL
jgi:hypothetical protein